MAWLSKAAGWLYQRLMLFIACWWLEAEDQVNDVRELYRLRRVHEQNRGVDRNCYWLARRLEQLGACRINGIAEWRLRLIM